MKFRDTLYLWGQDPGAHHFGNHYNLPGINRMDSMEGCRYFGIPNCCRVAEEIGPEPPFDGESAKLASLDAVIWSIIGAGGVKRNYNDQSDLDEVLRQAERFPNVRGAVMDDFFMNGVPRLRAETVRHTADRLHLFPGRRLDLWAVWYEYQLEFDVAPFFSNCDVVSFWTWYGVNYATLEKNLQRFCEKTPGNRHMLGIYFWNYGEKCPLTAAQMEHQCECARDLVMTGAAEGLILCSNCTADLGLASVSWFRKWLDRVGAEECPTVSRQSINRK